jgi:hypothetical protein
MQQKEQQQKEQHKEQQQQRQYDVDETVPVQLADPATHPAMAEAMEAVRSAATVAFSDAEQRVFAVEQLQPLLAVHPADQVLPVEPQLPYPSAPASMEADLQQLSQALASTQMCLWLAVVAMLVLASMQVAVLLVLGVVLMYRNSCRRGQFYHHRAASGKDGIVDARLEALL